MMGIAPLLLALAGFPAIAVAAWLAKDMRPASRGLAVRMALAVIVNALALSMWWHVRRSNAGPGAR